MPILLLDIGTFEVQIAVHIITVCHSQHYYGRLSINVPVKPPIGTILSSCSNTIETKYLNLNSFTETTCMI